MKSGLMLGVNPNTKREEMTYSHTLKGRVS